MYIWRLEQIEKLKSIKSLLIAYIVSFSLLLCASYLKHNITYSEFLRPLTKLISSSIFVIIALKGYRIGPKKNYRKNVLVAVFLCYLGDILLGIMFINPRVFFALGLFSFLMAHILFMIGLRRFSQFHVYEFIVPLGTSVAIFLLSKTTRMNFSDGLILLLIYGLFVGFLASICIENFRYQKNNKGIIMFSIGGILFYISDWILMVKMFSTKPVPSTEFWSLFVYYLAMIIIALSFGMDDD